ncbi:MAG: hypothetical protein QM757_18705 [Paludibaculum sp.]
MPFRLGAQQVFFGDHLENGADVLRHAAVDEDEALLEFVAGLGGDLLEWKDMVVGQEASAADAVSGSPSAARRRLR